MAPLSPEEQKQLLENERIIGQDWQTFVAKGQSLEHFREGRWYRVPYGSFTRYCQERWHYSLTHAKRLIFAAKFVTYLEPLGCVLPQHESQVRPLMGLPMEQAAQAWQKAIQLVQGRQITAQAVKLSAAGFKAKPKPPMRKSKSTKVSEANRRASANNTVLGLIKNADHFLLKGDTHYVRNALGQMEQLLRPLPH